MSVEKYSASPIERTGLGVAIGLWAIVAAMAIGCSSEPQSTLPKFTATTPEAKLERVMQRLDEAIVDASAAQGSGVVSQRKSSYRLIPPTKEGDPYRAEVKIETTLALSAASAAATMPKSEERKSTPAENEGIDAQPIDENLTAEPENTAPTDDAESDKAERRDNGVVTRRAVEQSKEKKTQVYELAFEGDQWKVVSEFDEEDELGPILFEYALAEL